MSIYQTAVRKPVTTALIYVALAVVGIFSLSRLAVDLLPNMSDNSIIVMTTYSGASAADIENITLMAGFAAASEKRKILTMVDILRQTELVQDSKKQNSGIKDNKDLSQRFVSEDYVKQQLGEK